MSIDIGRAASFLAAHGRVLDRRCFDLLTGRASQTDRAAVLAAVDGYRNGDGGYSWGIEPDLRAPESQPAGALQRDRLPSDRRKTMPIIVNHTAVAFIEVERRVGKVADRSDR